MTLTVSFVGLSVIQWAVDANTREDDNPTVGESGAGCSSRGYHASSFDGVNAVRGSRVGETCENMPSI